MLSSHVQLENAEDFQAREGERNQQFELKDGGSEEDEEDVDEDVKDVDISRASGATFFYASSRQAAQQYLHTVRLQYIMPVRGEQTDSPPS